MSIETTGLPSASIRDLASACRDAGAVIAQLPTPAKREVLEAMAATITARTAEILAANDRDVAAARAKGQTSALIDRLRLDAARLANVAAAIRSIATQPDPVGLVTSSDTRPNGIRVDRVRIPLGLIAMI